MKQKKCSVCSESFTPTRPLQKVCSLACSIELATRTRLKKEAAEHRERKKKAKTKAQWIRECQQIFNKYIRLRDHDKPCISCGKSDVEWTPGGMWDCGHFISIGSHPELRFVELNAYKQCKKCNGGSGRFAKKHHTVSKQYRENLIEKIGIEKVEWLEGPHEPKRYTIEDLQSIKAEYTRKARECEKNISHT